MYNHKRITDTKLLLKQVELFIEDAPSTISLLANLTALLKQYYPDANWIGFYLAKEDYLYLGPFQGESACQLIQWGKGVCGTAALTKTTQIVENVHKLKNHIACDVNSMSEIVIPIIINEKVYGVLDIDSPVEADFDKKDQDFLEALVELIKPRLEII